MSLDNAGDVSTGLTQFLQRHCSDPSKLASALASERRLMRCREGDFLCRRGDPADCVWIIESGLFAMRKGARIINRGPGEIIGEQAFLRDERQPRRGNDIETLVAGSVTIIDKAIVNQLTVEQRSLWIETLAKALSAKLDQATSQRSELAADVGQLENILNQFVCKRGLESAYAALRGVHREPIAPVATKAIVWFSDLAGFSAYAQSLTGPTEVGTSLKSLLDVQTALIGRAGGQIDKFIGDSVMAFWECRDSDRFEECARQAVQAAVETANYFRRRVKSEGWPVDIRIGLHAGDVVIGNFGGDDRIAFTLIGETVNAAARFEQARCDENGESLSRVRISSVLYSAVAGTPLGSKFVDEAVSFSDKHAERFYAYILKEEEAP